MAKSNDQTNTLEKESPPISKNLSYSLLCIVLLGVILYLGQGILIPLFFSILLASLLLPVSNFLHSKKLNHVLSILIPLILSLLLIMGVMYFLSSQIAHFFDDIPKIKGRVNELIDSLQGWIEDNFNITSRKQVQYINETAEKVKTEGPKIVGKTVISVTESLSYIILLPIYTFLILYYKDLIKSFFLNLFKNGRKEKVLGILKESRRVSQQYIGGLLIETVIVFGLNTLGFVILGIQYAIFLALLTALLNIIPYIGIIIANIICILITLVSSENASDALWVGIILAIVQIYDNNIGMPMVVGNNVRINALVTIVGVLIGGALCGIPGMFLAIPGLAVMKVVCDEVPELHAWGILLGDDTSKSKAKDKGGWLKMLFKEKKAKAKRA